MTAAELLRRLDKAATVGPWWSSAVADPCTVRTVGTNRAVSRCYVYDRESEDGPVASPTTVDAKCIATTRNLLPLLAGLVEAVGAQQDAVESDKMEDTGAISEPVWRAMMAVRGAWQALNAAAAKEVM